MKDKHTYGEKMARQGRTKVFYKGTFISKQSLPRQPHKKLREFCDSRNLLTEKANSCKIPMNITYAQIHQLKNSLFRTFNFDREHSYTQCGYSYYIGR